MNLTLPFPKSKAALNLAVSVGCMTCSWAQVAPIHSMMPQAKDHTSMGWAEGFPGILPDAPWNRLIQTGNYSMILNTANLQIPHLGPTVAAELPSPGKLELTLTADGKTYHCREGGKWSRYTGPRLIESGRFMQRADVTDLVFKSAAGERLNVEARFETVAWADRLALILAARPGLQSIQAGEASFGKIGGGFGLDGTNHLEIPHDPSLDPVQFTVDLWAFIPTDHGTNCWLLCKNHHEAAEGNYGITFVNGTARAVMNIGGGSANTFTVDAPRNQVKADAWNHLAISYDGETLRLFVNGAEAGAKKIGRKRVPGKQGLAIGRRQDNSGNGYHFRGVVDEIRFHDRALGSEEIRRIFAKPGELSSQTKAVREWSFRADGQASATRPSEQWKDASMEIKLTSAKGALSLHNRWHLPPGETWKSPAWHEVSLAFNPATFEAEEKNNPVIVKASAIPTATPCPVDYDPSRGWHRVNLDDIEPTPPPGSKNPSNDAIERVKLSLTNPTADEQIARLMFEKNRILQRIGSPITGISAILRDAEGSPTGIPVQLSKNWHNEPEGGVYAGHWFHGISQVRLPPGSTVELELTLAYGHWGGVAAASHAQLSLVGWGSNQLWDQSALGAWGESICYEPDQAQANCTITDVRPLMVESMGDRSQWGWTSNVGGGDFFRFFDPAGKRIPHSAMRTTYHRQGPCLTEVTYAGRIGTNLKQAMTVSLARTDDIVRGIYQIRLNVDKPTDFSRFVIFQIGADTYSYTGERKMALGDETGLLKEWDTQWGGNTYRTPPTECRGRIPWASLHQAVPRENRKPGAWANRGIVIRSWKARLGGKDVAPWMAEHGITIGPHDSSTLDIVPPPGVIRLEPGDFVEATIAHLVIPQFAKDYYGPNEPLRAALKQDENSWRMIHREASGNDLVVKMETGTLERLQPDVRIRTDQDAARLNLSGGLGFIPITFTGLSSHRGYSLEIDGKALDQRVHGNDFWQTDYDPSTRRWSHTYNIPAAGGKPRTIQFQQQP